MNLKQILISAYSTLIQNKKLLQYTTLFDYVFAKYLKIVVMNFTVDLMM